ncbi:ATP-binding cassette domain-containing protein [bacterium]|nr:ATP-binding cassette domain-containing protein [bacterium]
MGLMALEGASTGALSYLVRPMFDEVHQGAAFAVVARVAASVGGVFMLRAVAGFGNRIIVARQAERIGAELQAAMLAHALRLDLSFYLANSPGSLMERLRGDTATLRSLWPPILQALGRDVVALISLAAVALMVDWRWTLIALAGVPLLALPLMRLQARVRGTARAARAAAGALSTQLDEAFHGIRTLQLSGAEAQESTRYRGALDRFLAAQYRSDRSSAAIPALIDIVAALGFSGVMLFGGMQIIAGTKTLGEFMSFFTAMGLVFEPLRRLGSISGQWAAARASLERIRGLLDEVPKITSPERPQPLPGTGGVRVRMEGVSFGYGDTLVLQDITLEAQPGKVTALVGPSGAGKTTIFHLLTRLADPGSGQVTLNGVDLRDLDLAELRRQFAVVSQDSALFDEAIATNVRLGASDLSDAGLARALHLAHADFVEDLPQGAAAPAGPRGTALSGGQRQRVAIARAILRDAPILLLDEATSALDSQTERKVTEALDRLREGRTTFVIAHRLSTIQAADEILVMNKGRIVDRGTHAELLARGGLYADLYRLQFKE